MYVVGGLGLNSVCNGQLVRDGMFGDVLLPPYQGYDGIAVGCCVYGLFGNRYDTSSSASSASSISSDANHEDKDRIILTTPMTKTMTPMLQLRK